MTAQARAALTRALASDADFFLTVGLAQIVFTFANGLHAELRQPIEIAG